MIQSDSGLEAVSNESLPALEQFKVRKALIGLKSCLEISRLYGSQDVLVHNPGTAFGDPFRSVTLDAATVPAVCKSGLYL